MRGHRLTVPILAAVLACAVGPAHAASISRNYSYYGIDGTTLTELQEQLARRGPHVGSTGQRHPGATEMEFSTRLSYAQSERSCRVAKATVNVEAKIILPRWNRRSGADPAVALIWDTLAADIRRHEQSHTVIARTHAHELEQALLAIRPTANCELAAAEARRITAEILARHDAAQARFDRIELLNFEQRLLRLLDNRLSGGDERRLSR